jgi:hypothetical protein
LWHEVEGELNIVFGVLLTQAEAKAGTGDFWGQAHGR